MTIFIDFDHTLFDTKHFRKAYPIVERVKTILWKGDDLSAYVFNDATPFLKAHENQKLILITYGNRLFQKAKVKDSGLSSFFSELVFTGLEHKGNTIKRMLNENTYQEPVVFIDDRMYQLESVRAKCPTVKVIRMNRLGQPDSDAISYSGCHEVKNMEELSALLQTLS